MTKADIVAEVAERTGETKIKCDSVVTAVIECIKEYMKEGEKITIQGFGTFESIERPSRIGRNPKTGEVITIDSRKLVKFKSSDAFKYMLNS